MKENTIRLIDNAYIALSICEQSKSKWGINYWTSVVNNLLRKYNRLN